MKSVVVDGVSALYRALIDHGLEEDSPGTEYGFVRILADLKKSFSNQRLSVLWGEPTSPEKSDCPGYGRRGADFSAFGLTEIVDDVKGELSCLGVDQYVTDRGEPLDLFFSAESEFGEPRVVWTADRRFFCMVGPKTAVKMPDGSVYDVGKVRDEFGAGPDEMDLYLALFGEETVGISGSGLRMSQVSSVIEKSGDEAGLFDEHPFLDHRSQMRLSVHEPRFGMNLRLVRPDEVEFDEHPGEYDESDAVDYLESLDGDMNEDAFAPSSGGFTKYG